MSRRAYSDTFFSTDTLDCERYCDTIVCPFIAQLKGDAINKATFHDGAIAHTAHMSMAILDDVFVDRIIL